MQLTSDYILLYKDCMVEVDHFSQDKARLGIDSIGDT